MNKTRKKSKEPDGHTGLSKVHVQNFGLFWATKFVDWDEKTLEGRYRPYQYKKRLKPKEEERVNFWGQKGVYVLHQNFTPIYVGQIGVIRRTNDTEDKAIRVLGDRLKEHLNDDLAGKWDRFSWFGFHRVIKGPTLGNIIGHGESTAISYKEEVHLLEAVLISIFGGFVQNKQDGGWKNINVHRYDQVETDEALQKNDPILKFTAQQLKDQNSKIKELQDTVDEVEKLVTMSSNVFVKTFPSQPGRGIGPRIEKGMNKEFAKLENDIQSVNSKVKKINKRIKTNV